MIKDFKLGLRLLKYGYGMKGMSISAVILLVLAVPLCAASMLRTINFPGGYFLLLASFILSQGMISLCASNLVMASPARKRLEVSGYVMIQFVGSLAAYLLVLVIGGAVAVCFPEQIGSVSNQILLTSFLVLVMSLYAGACRKYFVASTIGFVLLFMLSQIFVDVEGLLSFLGSGWGLFAKSALAGLALVLCGNGLQYLCNLALYRAPMSRLAQTAGLRKSL